MKRECRPENILDKLNTLERYQDKKSYMGNVLIECGAPYPASRAPRSTPRLKKRKLSGYNCFIKDCAQKTGDFRKCVKDRIWATFSAKKKDEWKIKADNGCNI